MKLKPILKAYEVDFNNTEEAELVHHSVYCYAENMNQAKSRLLSKLKKMGETHLFLKDDMSVFPTIINTPLTYKNIPVKRCKDLDKYLFEGQELTMSQIDKIKQERHRLKKLDEILKNHSVTYCYILKHGFYYRPNSKGYTASKSEAGVYTIVEGVTRAKKCQELHIQPVSIHEHNSMIRKEIETLKSRLLLKNQPH